MPNNRLLLIEDDHDVAEMLLMYFNSHGYQVYHADNGPVGIDMARTTFPNLILLDVMLPVMDGYDVCVQLRHTALTKYIPILFLTQKDERASKVRGLELGADDYITKPFDIDELRLRVQGSIRRATRENLHETRTGLPTGPLVAEERARRTIEQCELLFRLENFSSYNDVYGFVAGNQVMSYAGRTIQQVIGEQGTANDFVGVDSDEFVVLTHSPDPDALADAVVARFNNEIHTFYSFLDVDQGGIRVVDDGGGESLVPLMRLSVEARTSAGNYG
jgi:PleD family two-component response regulator